MCVAALLPMTVLGGARAAIALVRTRVVSLEPPDPASFAPPFRFRLPVLQHQGAVVAHLVLKTRARERRLHLGLPGRSQVLLPVKPPQTRVAIAFARSKTPI